MEWQNGRQLSRATTERDSTTEDVLDFAYDANGIRTSKTVTRNTYRPVQTYKVTFVADGKTVKTMSVTEGYTLKDSDYPAVPEKAGYTGAWQRYPSPVQSNVTVSATYTKITTYYTVTFVADGETVKTISVYSGYKLKDSDYPRVPYKAGYEGSWQKRTAPVTSNVTINAVYTQILHTVSFRVMDEGIIHTMEVPDRYVLQEEDYPTIPKRVGYTSRWDTRVTMIVRDTIIDAIYSDGSTHEVTFLAYGNENLGTITVEDGYLLQEEDYPTIPERTGYRGSWPTQVDPIYEDTIIHAQYEEAIPVPTLPTDPGEIMSGGEGEPVEADEPEEGENDTTPAETERTISGVLASTETVTHEYLTQSGKVVRETITTSMDTTTLDFFYDESGRPFAFNYTPEGSTPNTYYYILNLQGDVVQIIDEGGVLQAEYVYSPWGEVISAEGDLAEVNPLRYRGYYYDSETGFYYLQSRYYDPENHRFINADSYQSTGYGFVGTNMFAYCNNSPIGYDDYAGTSLKPTLCYINDCSRTRYRDVTAEVNEKLYIQTMIAEAHTPVAFGFTDILARAPIYLEFYLLVNHEAIWDIKRPTCWENLIGTPFPGEGVKVIYRGELMTPEDIGNFTYGYLGGAYNIPLGILYAGSYYAAGYPTSPEDRANEANDRTYITKGYIQYIMVGGYK